ncbi:MAG TPA: uroporphyrinogen decarboxylase [Planctomycetota bacterium]|nr:uroporphyrinogen decarboxylase [Planctomycetota bacterium]
MSASFRLLQAAQRKPVDQTPVWFMRQAGRFLPEYRELRKSHSILEICADPELAAAAAMTAVKALPGLDGAIVFSDILQILLPMGIKVEFAPGEGPRILNPVGTAADVAALRPVEPERDLRGPLGAIRILRRELEGRMPVIGFAGAPFTLATYLVEGGPSKDYAKVKRFMGTEPRAWDDLMTRLGHAVAAHLSAQAAAGAAIVQVFDSWVGVLGVDDYRRFVQPHMRRVFEALRGKVPTIHFGTGTAALLELMREAGGDVIGLDWRVDLADAWNRLGPDVAVQGNLDPSALLLPLPELGRRIDAVLDRAAGRPGHIFNLGHGILPETPVEHVAAAIERVHARRVS